ncbi:MAG: dynamin family protein [Betaproteobacteria bacterium]|nr:dynamin family protein [Betaproteobacteria bacterium]
MTSTTLAEQFSAFSDWRANLGSQLRLLRQWLEHNDLVDPALLTRLGTLQDRLRQERLSVAFVAEFSRGKSELINAMFFADYGQRILPSSAGRTTMCPTELLYDEARPPCLDLLPIETRMDHPSVGDIPRGGAPWIHIDLDVSQPARLHEALARLGECRHVPREQAAGLGFVVDEEGEHGLRPDADGTVEIPCWRHAVVNIPHPLLRQGLTVIDTPGLNAIGAEPELTLSLLPSAHAVLFVLAADTGVTQSDLTVWRDHVVASAGGGARARLVVLNKIDGLWDGLRSEAEIDGEIARQARNCAVTLGVDAARVFPVSAQKALYAKVTEDPLMLSRSRLARLEEALSAQIIPARREIIAEGVQADALGVVAATRDLLRSRHAGLREQVAELSELRGRNQNVVQHMLHRVKMEKAEFDAGLQQYQAVRRVLGQLSTNLFAALGIDGVREQTRRTRQTMLASNFSSGLLVGMDEFFTDVRQRLDGASAHAEEIHRMLGGAYARFADSGLSADAVKPFDMQPFQTRVQRLLERSDSHFRALVTLMTTEKRALTQRFFETIAVQVRRTFELANRELDNWLRNVMTPLEAHIREQQKRLKHRMENMKHIHQAIDGLEERLALSRESEQTTEAQLGELEEIGRLFRTALQGEKPDELMAIAA